MIRPDQISLNDGWRFQFAGDSPDTIELPHTWNALDTMDINPARHYRRGTGIYERGLAPPALGEDERLWCQFEAASQRATVYLNERVIGTHAGGYTAFTVELTPRRWGLRPDDALRLRVEVDNRPDPDLVPSDMSDFFLYGGLTRNAWLYTTGSQSVDKLWIDATPDGSVTVRGDLVQYEASQVIVRIYEPCGALCEEQTIDTRSTGFTCECSVPVYLWSPDDPQLFQAEIEVVGSDIVRTMFGLREIRFPPGGPFFLNGEPLLLRGTHRHEDWAGCGSAVPDELSRHELRLIKDAGFNFVRLGHYPQSPAVLNACDELGLLVWIELPWCRGGIGGERFQATTRAMLVEMIEQYYNHASIIFWGLGNELDWESEHPDSTDEKVAMFLQELHDLTHKLDPHRLTALRRFEPGAAIVDVYSPSIWSGWYRGRYQDYERVLHDALDRYPNFFHAEWGGDSHVGRHNTGPHLHTEIAQSADHAEIPGLALSHEGFARASRDSDWSESYMLDVMEWHLQVQQRAPHLSGSAQWVFSDFGTPLRPENPIPFVNQKGLIDRAGRKKDVYYLFQSYQATKPMCYIESPSWPVRAGLPGDQHRVRVYSNCDRVTLFVNGVEHETRQRDVSQFPAAGLVWYVELCAGENVMRAVGRAADGSEVEHTIAQTLIAPSDQPAAQVIATRLSARVIRLQLADSGSVPVLYPEQFLDVSLISGGVLTTRQGTPDGSQRIQTANGRIDITFKPDGNPIAICARAERFEQGAIRC